MKKKRGINLNDIICEYLKTKDARLVANKFSLTHSHVRHLLIRANVYEYKPIIRKVSNDILLESYKRLNNVWLVAKEVGLCGQSVHERLVKLNAIHKENRTINSKNKFRDYDTLREKYLLYKNNGKLDDLAKEMGRTKHFICRKARELGLTDIRHKKVYKNPLELSIRFKNYHATNEHPKGMLGKTHTLSTRKQLSKSHKESWKNKTEKDKYLHSKRLVQRNINNTNINSKFNRIKASWKCRWQMINYQFYFFRSHWEYQYCIYLEYLRNTNKIKAWLHEPDRFVFDFIGNKVSSFLPDFKIINLDDSEEYHEVKGWMDKRSIDSINNMAMYYPNVKLKIIRGDWFKENKFKIHEYGYTI